MKTELSIGFIILTWNSDQYIQGCIDSIFLLPNVNVYISVFDNGSKDNTISILKKYECDKRVFVNRVETNIGTTKSRNIAFKSLPKCDYICVLDSDTEIKDTASFINMIYYLNNNNVGIIGPKLVNDKLTQPSARPVPSIKDKFKQFIPCKKVKKEIEEKNNLLRFLSNSNDVIYAGYLMSACFVLPYKLFVEINGFDEKIFYAPEDVDFCVRVWDKGYPVCLYKYCQVFHYWQRISRKKIFSKHNFEHIKGLLYIKRKFKKTLIKYINTTCEEKNGTKVNKNEL